MWCGSGSGSWAAASVAVAAIASRLVVVDGVVDIVLCDNTSSGDKNDWGGNGTIRIMIAMPILCSST